jgi:hypothetical protein
MTAEDFLKSKDHNITDDGELYDGLLTNNVLKDMVEFTKLQVEIHVEAALRRAYQNQGMSWTNSDKEETKIGLFIKNSYPKIDIK